MTEARASAGGAAYVVVAAAIAGVLGLVLTTVAARSIGAAATAGFTAFWSSTYFVIGALAGIQQEVARATHPADDARGATPLRRFALIAAAVVTLLVLVLGAAWTLPVFSSPTGWALAPALAVGACGYVLVAVVAGASYGLHRWSRIAALVIGDAALRILAVGVCLLFTHDIVVLAWAIALPFGATLVLLWPFVGRGLAGTFAVDVPVRRLSGNAGKAVVGSLATAVLVSGTSLAIVVTSPEVPTAVVGAFVFAVTVIRAPIMVGVQALQSYLVVRFRDAEGRARLAVLIGVGVVVAGMLLSGAAVLWGDAVLTAVLGEEFAIGPAALAVVVASSALMGVLFVTGPYAIATSRHGIYAAGWIVAAVVSIGSLLLPLPFETRTALALLAGPATGVVVQVSGLLLSRSRVSV